MSYQQRVEQERRGEELDGVPVLSVAELVKRKSKQIADRTKSPNQERTKHNGEKISKRGHH